MCTMGMYEPLTSVGCYVESSIMLFRFCTDYSFYRVIHCLCILESLELARRQARGGLADHSVVVPSGFLLYGAQSWGCFVEPRKGVGCSHTVHVSQDKRREKIFKLEEMCCQGQLGSCTVCGYPTHSLHWFSVNIYFYFLFLWINYSIIFSESFIDNIFPNKDTF